MAVLARFCPASRRKGCPDGSPRSSCFYLSRLQYGSGLDIWRAWQGSDPRPAAKKVRPRHRQMWPDEQFFFLTEAGRGLTWSNVCAQWLPEWLPGILLAELTF
jgi:hypothetical protein